MVTAQQARLIAANPGLQEALQAIERQASKGGFSLVLPLTDEACEALATLGFRIEQITTQTTGIKW